MNAKPSNIEEHGNAGESAETTEPQRQPGTPAADANDPEAAEDLQAKLECMENDLLRAKADLQNFRRRADTERSEAIRFANAELMRSLLTVLDDFERSLEAAQAAEDQSALVEGVRLVYANLVKALSQHGLEPIDARNQTFDPTVHEAVLQQQTDEVPPGTVMDQVAKGYRLRDRLLRPAKVVVAKAPEER